MLKLSLGTTVAFFRNHKPFLLINLLGLTTALAACYFALVYVGFELGYDSFHKNAKNIYRVVVDAKTSNGIDYRGTSPAMAPVLKETLPEVVSSTRVLLDYLIFQDEHGVQREEHIAYADSTLFSVFTFPLIQGSANEILNVPFQIVLSESAAKKYFNNDDPVGKTLLINGKDRAYVTGVMKDMPYNAHFRTDVLVSISTLLNEWNPSMGTNWKGHRAGTYVVLSADTDIAALNTKLTRLLRSKIDRGDVEYLTQLEPLESIYLHGKPRGSRSGSAVTGSITNVYVCSLAAMLILFIASLNYVNLATAFSMQRAKEIGVRKLLGASRGGLTTQFLVDAIMLSALAFAISIIFIALMIPAFNQVTGKTITDGILDKPLYVAVLLGVALVTGALSGLYPAFFLSAFKPIDGLKGRFTSSTKGIRLRKILVTGQFFLSFVLIVATTVLYRQLQFMQHRDLGFKKDHMLSIDFQFDLKAGNDLTRVQMLTIPGVSKASISSSLPGRANTRLDTRIENFHGTEEQISMDAYFIDSNFIDQYGLKIIAGRSFSSLIASDTINAMMVNEAAVRSLGYSNPENIIGKHYTQSWGEGVIIGVLKDFHFASLREEVQPLTFQAGAGFATFLTLTISGENLSSTIPQIEQKWKQILPDMPLIYFFTDDNFNSLYDSDERFSHLFLGLVTIAIIISCIGLFGLSVFNTALRTKEIGVRKILGSSPLDIVKLLTKDFLVLIAIGICLGVPLSWYAMNQWLSEFAFHIDLSIGIFLFAGVVLTTIAFATICFQTLRAAHADPVKSLGSTA